ncbi:MAG TPA: hypothetical protein PK513_05600 [Alphaproteobacteria bacterium]|nr:hypothetical protein [Alphaproteobacteria bacterium]USO06540.1 MAG: hypothetical protein H6859_05065 [Rhodospirillales bacterium]HOO81957.1 hypothetical protein [Alphaproteobacteria bacterium]
MSLEYAENRIKEALKLSGGNQIKARQQIIAWTFEDAKLLHALAKPHLSGIVAYNIERVASGRADAARAKAGLKPEKPQATQKSKASNEEAFGFEILKAIAGSSQMFGLEDAGAPRKRAPTSQAHVDALRAIASKQKKTD